MNNPSYSYKADILVVESSPDELRLLSNFLRQQGYYVRQALDKEMSLIATETVLPDLLLVAIQIPYINGYEICQHLRSNSLTQEIPVIFLATVNETSARIKAFQVGGNDYLSKPYDLEEVLIRVKHQLLIKQQYEQLKGEKTQLQQQLRLQELTQYAEPESSEYFYLLKLAIAATHNGIVIVDATQTDLPIVYVNPGFEKMTGYAFTEAVGNNCRFLQGSDREQPELAELRQAIQEKRKCCVTLRNYRKDGTLFWNEISLSPVRDLEGNVDYFIGVQTDVTERKRAEEEIQRSQSSVQQMNRELYRLNNQLHRLANLDGLTGVANRRCFDERLEHEWQRLSRENQALSLILGDIDYFKRYNDTYGHLEGDHCLKSVATAINHCLHRPADLVARCGGEEFAVILPNTSLKGALIVAQRMQESIKHLKIPHQSSEVDSYVTMSLGVASQIPATQITPKTLQLAADQALYQAKAQGRDQIVAYEDEMAKN